MLAEKEVPCEVSRLLNRIVEQLRVGEIRLGECTKDISEYADACVNPEAVCIMAKKIRQTVILPVEENEEN